MIGNRADLVERLDTQRHQIVTAMGSYGLTEHAKKNVTSRRMGCAIGQNLYQNK